MNVLQITSLVPVPANDGGRVGLLNITRHFTANGITVHFAAPRMTVSASTEQFEKEVILHLLDVDCRTTMLGAAWHLFSREPYLTRKYFSRKALEQLRGIMKREAIDLIQVESLHMARYALELRKEFNVPITLREHNVQADIVGRYRTQSKNPLFRWYAGIEYKRMCRHEQEIIAQFDLVLPITPDDERRLMGMTPQMVSYLLPGSVQLAPLPFVEAPKQPKLLFMTNFDWPPNRDSFHYYHDAIVPEILKLRPQTETVVVGKGTKRLMEQSLDSSIRPEGFVERFTDIATLGQVAVVPLRAGSGVRIKILELMALGICVLSTRLGAEGLDVVSGTHLFIEDDPRKFAEQAVRLLATPDECARVARNARLFVEEHHSGELVGKKFAERLELLVKEFHRQHSGVPTV